MASERKVLTGSTSREYRPRNIRRPMSTRKTCTTRLGRALKLMRADIGQGVRGMAAEIGIPFPTLNRIENGRPFDLDTYVKLMAWLTKKHETAPEGTGR
jgi:hypothetical protein